MGRKPSLDLGNEPQFETDSFNIPDEALTERPAQNRAPKTPTSSKLPIIIGGVVVVIVGVAAAAFMFSGSDESPVVTAAPSTAVAAEAPDPAKPAAPDETKAAQPETKPEKKAPEQKAPAAKAPEKRAQAKVVEAPAPAKPSKPAVGEVPKKKSIAKKTTKKRRRKRGNSDAKFDAALDRLNKMGPAAPAADETPKLETPADLCEKGTAKGCLDWGKNLTSKDPAAAIDAYAKACALGSSTGCLRAGGLSEKSGGGQKAREYFMIACGRKSAQGCRQLASLWQHGVGGAPDLGKAKQFYKKACEYGDTDACEE